MIVAGLVFGAARADADDRITVGYLASRPIAATGSGIAHSFAARWDRAFTPYVEAGVGLEVGWSEGGEALQRVAVLPGVAIVYPVGAIVIRFEEQGGWQLVHGSLTLDGIPLRGTETRSFHDELALAADAVLTETVDLRARIGLAIDGIYPVGHASTRASPFVGLAVVIRR